MRRCAQLIRNNRGAFGIAHEDQGQRLLSVQPRPVRAQRRDRPNQREAAVARDRDGPCRSRRLSMGGLKIIPDHNREPRIKRRLPDNQASLQDAEFGTVAQQIFDL